MTGDLIYDQALIGDGETTSCLIGDHLTMLIGDQADWSLIGGGKTGPESDSVSV